MAQPEALFEETYSSTSLREGSHQKLIIFLIVEHNKIVPTIYVCLL